MMFNIRCLLVVSILFAGSVAIGSLGDMGGGDGQEQTPYLIQDIADFIEFSSVDNAHLYWSKDVHTKLDCDLNLDPSISVVDVFQKAVIAPDIEPDSLFFQGQPYCGKFDGNGKTISNFKLVTNDNNDYLGLFGMVADTGEVKNLNLQGIYIISGPRSYCIGGVAGSAKDTIIRNCSSSGIISCGECVDYVGGLIGSNTNGYIDNCISDFVINTGQFAKKIGGLCGVNNYGTIMYSSFNGTVSGGYDLGGLCGSNKDGIISYCFTNASVFGNNDSSSIGGFCGYNEFGGISSCYSDSMIESGDGNFLVGGFCGGNNEGSIYDCYSKSSIEMDESFYKTIGGFCGENFSSVIENCFSAGAILVDEKFGYAGGFCGQNSSYNYYAKVNNCFWDMDISGIESSDGGTGLSTTEMVKTDVYVENGWDNIDIWKIGGNGYPTLAWQHDFTYQGDTFIEIESGDSSSVEIQLRSLVDNPVNWKVFKGASCSWISSITPESGSGLGLNSSVIIQVNIDASGLARGEYRNKIYVKNDIGGVLEIPLILNVAESVDLTDFAVLAANWLSDCSDMACFNADWSGDGIIDMDDLVIFTDNWLENVSVATGHSEGFEGGIMTSGGFESYGDQLWQIIQDSTFEGEFAVKSGAISDSQKSVLQFCFETTGSGNISFAARISTEEFWDTLSFYIDDDLQGQWSGQYNWSVYTFPVTDGVHTFRWEYIKDESLSEGLDSVWIDNVIIK